MRQVQSGQYEDGRSGATVRTEVAGLDNRRCNAIPMWLVRSFASHTIRLHKIVEGICLWQRDRHRLRQ